MEQVCYAKSSRKEALAWTTIAFFAGFAGVSTFGPIIPKLNQSMALGPVHMGLLGAIPALTGSLLRIPFGAMVDRVGGKKPILLLLGLSATGIAGTTMMFKLYPSPLPHHYHLFLLFGALCGCGIAIFSVGIPTVSYWYPQKKQGAALALYGGLGNLAPGIFAFVLPILVVQIGLSVSYVLWLTLLLLEMAVFYFFMKDAPYFQYKEMGIEIDEDALIVACGEELIPTGSALASLRKAAADWRTWVLTAFYFVSFGGFIALTVWFPTYWKEYFSMSLVQAGALTALYSLLASILRVFGGFTSDLVGGEKTVCGSFLAIVTGAILIMLPSHSVSMALGGVLFLALGMGFANAAVFKLVPKFMPEAVGGTAGIVGGLGAFGGFVIPILMGLFIKFAGNGGYPLGFSVFLVLSVISLILFAFLSRANSRAPKHSED
ncbi:MAG: NarK/NasA family nitrate transporter [Deltaproteobacteria bacterium]|nr:NarK/NasA family nitrate transporter [Deltaproteobacteria bacterium]